MKSVGRDSVEPTNPSSPGQTFELLIWMQHTIVPRPLVVFLVASSMLAIAGAATEDEAIRKLATATQIETNRIYEAAEPSELAHAFKFVLDRHDAKQRLLRIFQEAKTNAGRVYALTGLRRVDEDEYRARIAIMNPDDKVKAMWYDVLRVFTVRELAKMIESGELEEILLPQEKR